MRTLYTLTIISLLAFVASGCMDSKTDLPPGHYESKNVSTDSNGTESVNKTETNVSEDPYGNKTAVVTKKNSTDPKGLFNKSTSKSTSVYENDNQ